MSIMKVLNKQSNIIKSLPGKQTQLQSPQRHYFVKAIIQNIVPENSLKIILKGNKNNIL